MKKYILILLVIIFGVFIYFTFQKESVEDIISINGHQIHIEYADTDALRTQGLSGRKTILLDQGMFFVFNTPQIYSFWMKDMYFSIDILWINEQYTIVDITNNLSPVTYPETVSPKEKAMYVLELHESVVETYNIKIGDTIFFDRK